MQKKIPGISVSVTRRGRKLFGQKSCKFSKKFLWKKGRGREIGVGKGEFSTLSTAFSTGQKGKNPATTELQGFFTDRPLFFGID